MGYTTGLLDTRLTILNPVGEGRAFGKTTEYKEAGTVWANVTWKKGAKNFSEGALDSVDSVLVRMRWNCIAQRTSRLMVGDVVYQIQSFHASKRENTIQITATEIVKQ